MTNGYASAEAFCLMKYATDDGDEVEWLWNSRDGVTPFVIANRERKREMTHVDWKSDTRLPEDFIPPKGMRIFVDRKGSEYGEPSVKEADGNPLPPPRRPIRFG